MAWTYEQNFNALTTGDLHNQDSWTSPEGKLVVGTAQMYEGAKSVTVTNDTTPYGANRAFTAVTGTGHVYFAVRVETKSAFDAGGSYGIRLKDTSAGVSARIILNNADIGIGNSSDTLSATIVSNYTAGQYYLIDVDYDITGTQIRARAHNGASWSAYTSWVTITNITQIDTFGVYGGTVSGSTTAYLDDITTTNPISLITSLKAYYKLDDVNDSVASYHLTNANSVAFNAGLIGNGADFGSSDADKSLHISSDLGIGGYDDAITISLWVKLNTEITSGAYNFVEHNKGQASNYLDYTVTYQYNAGTLRLGFWRERNGVAGYYGYYNITLGTSSWYHLVITFDSTVAGGTFKGYVNAVERYTVASCAGNGTYDVNIITKFVLGASWNGYSTGVSNNALAIIDEVGVWNRALSADEITSLYNGGAGLQYPFFTNWTQSLSASVSMSESRTSRAGINKTAAFTFSESKTSQTGINKTTAFSFIEAIAKNVGKSTTDSMSMSEDAAQIPAFQRNPTESFSFLESKTTLSDFQRAFSDNLIFAESLSKQSGKTLSESFSIIETISRVVPFQRALSESLSVSEALSKIVPFQRMISETITIVESLQKHANLSFSSALGFVESMLTTSEYSRSLTENLNLAESMLKLAEFKLNFSIIISIAENLSKNIDMSFSAALQILESFSKTSEFNLQKIDTLSLAELISKHTGKHPADVVSILDSVPLVERGIITSATESISITEQFRKDIGMNFSNNLTISESKTALVDFIRTFSDSVQITESLAKQFGLSLQDLTIFAENIMKSAGRHASEILSISESKTQTIGLKKTDSISFSESFAKEARKQNVDSLQLSELSYRSPTVAVTDSISFQDILKFDSTKKIIDMLVIAESVLKAMSISKNEILLITENAAKQTSRPLSDTVSIAESHLISRGYGVNIVDSVALLETLIKDFGLSISDASALTAVISLNYMSAFATQRTTVLTTIQGRTVLLAR